MRLTEEQQQTLRVAIDRIIPADDYPGAWESGVGAYLARQFESDLAPVAADYCAGLTALEAESVARFQQSFAIVSDEQRDTILAAIEAGEVLTTWPVAPQVFFRLLVNTTAEGFYSNPEQGGNRDAVSWAMIGFEEGEKGKGEGGKGNVERVKGKGEAVTGEGSYPPFPLSPFPLFPSSSPVPLFPSSSPVYDAIIIGTGAAGGIVAGVLAEAGKHVLLLERGRALSFSEVGRDHLRNQRLSIYGHNAGPALEGNPRVFVDPLGNERTVRPHEPEYHNNAACVGGGTRVYGAQAWRFMPADFRMASTYGVPEGSSLSDWPITYDDLEPFYERAEWELGVAGDARALRDLVPRRRDYPLPPIAPNPQTVALQSGARQLGWRTSAVPLLINTLPYGGRDACIACKYCVGFACPTDAKNGSQNTMIPRALATGNCKLVTGAIAERIETDASGKVTAVAYLLQDGDTTQAHQARAKVVIVSGGAIESARLLLNSQSTHHPNGLGNEYDQVGRNLQGHLYPRAYGLMPEKVFSGIGPGVTLATTQFNHGNPGIIGGGMLADDFIKPPIDFWYDSLSPDLPRWGLANKRFMRDNFTRVLHVRGPVQDVPNPEGRVTVDRGVRDRWGIPVARLSGSTHPATVVAAEFMRVRGEEWLKASGCESVWSFRPGLVLSGGQHQAGTCRMGHDPKTSVTDVWGRVHNHDNLFVVDGSLHVTNGGFNPVLTIMALAFRSALHIAGAQF